MKTRVCVLSVLLSLSALTRSFAAESGIPSGVIALSGDALAAAITIAACFIPQWTPTNGYPKSAINIDMAFFDEALEVGGLGWGVSAEQAVNDSFSIKVRHGLFDREFDETRKVNITVSDIYLCYNFDHKGLSGFNLDFGFGYANPTDTVTGDKVAWMAANEYFIPYIAANLGYRFNFGNLMIEPYYNYIHPLVNTHFSETGIVWSYVDMIGLNIGAEF